MYAIIQRNNSEMQHLRYHKRDILNKCWSGWKSSLEQAVDSKCDQKSVTGYRNVGDFIEDKEANAQSIVCIYSADEKYTISEFRDIYPEYFI